MKAACVSKGHVLGDPFEKEKQTKKTQKKKERNIKTKH